VVKQCGNCKFKKLHNQGSWLVIKTNGHTSVGEESAMRLSRLSNGRIHLSVDGSFVMDQDAARQLFRLGLELIEQ